jgi:hypothetical protein
MASGIHQEILEKLLDKLFIIFAVTVFPSLIASLSRVIDLGWQPIFSIHIFLFIVILSFAIFRKSISYSNKIICFLSTFLILAISDGIYFGKSAFLVEFLMLSLFICVIFSGIKQSILIFSFGALLILSIGILTVNGILSPITTNELFSNHLSSWFAILFGFSFNTAVVILIAGDIGHILSEKITELQQANITLKTANEEIKQLQGMIRICAQCNKVRDSKGYWDQVEFYISDHSEAEFSHGLCEDCMVELYGHHEWFKLPKKKADNA